MSQFTLSFACEAKEIGKLHDSVSERALLEVLDCGRLADMLNNSTIGACVLPLSIVSEESIMMKRRLIAMSDDGGGCVVECVSQ
ncbi:hypothetical protein KIN20_004497 [Parelaphostrongylus tenuis]|uniref:Uncharacterized protein n=1 Tax=Parelaphostrongylus tenuis TaxID=148309 RepID=A0AAD5MH35_PARTN|nr:hypothetical protein KIN20_004497 [Parelaphostrongylus tenuis]